MPQPQGNAWAQDILKRLAHTCHKKKKEDNAGWERCPRARTKQCSGVRERCSGVRSVRAFGFKTFGPCFGIFVLFGTVFGLFGVLFCSVIQGMCFVRLFCSGVSTHCEFVRLF